MGGKKEEGFKPLRGHGDEGRPHPYTISGNKPGTTPGTQNSCPVGKESALQVAGHGESGLGHPRWHLYPGVGGQCRQS